MTLPFKLKKLGTDEQAVQQRRLTPVGVALEDAPVEAEVAQRAPAPKKSPLRLADQSKSKNKNRLGDDAQPCPSCESLIEKDAQMCTSCGMNLKSGTKVKTKIKLPRKASSGQQGSESKWPVIIVVVLLAIAAAGYFLVKQA